MNRITKLRQQRTETLAAMRAMLAEAGDAPLPTEQAAAYDALEQKLSTLDTEIDRQLRLDEVDRAAPAQAAAPADPSRPAPRVTGVRSRAEDDPRYGFPNHREYLLSVMKNSQASSVPDVRDERLRPLALVPRESDPADAAAGGGPLAFLQPRAWNPKFLAAAGSDEQGSYQDSIGGYAERTSLLPGLLTVGMENDPISGRTTAVPMGAVSVEILARTDKDHSSSVAGGFTVTRRPETVSPASSRSTLEKIKLRATSLFGVAFETEELLSDSVISFVALIDAGFRDQFAHHMIGERLRGTGGDQYLGILTALSASSLGPTISIAKETGQAAATIVTDNALKMRARCWGYGQAIWLANHDCYPQLAKLTIPVGTGGVAVYQQSLVEDRPDMLLGRPIFYTEYASTLGTQGDLICSNWSQFLEGLYQPLQSAESMHVRFLNHERTFKFWLRNCGAPWWRTALTPNQSTATLSPFVVLDTRA